MAADKPHQIPSAIAQLLSGVRRQIRFRVLVDGWLVAMICALLVFWVGGLLDFLPVTVGSNEMPRPVRAGLLAVMGGLVLWALIWRLARRYFRSLPDRNLAVLLERHFPELNNELVTVVELARRRPEQVSNPAAYQAMLERVEQSAAGRASRLDTRPLLNWTPVWWQSLAAGGLLLLTLVMLIAQPAWMRLWSERLFALSDVRWPRLARLEIDGVLVQLPAFTGQLSAERVTLPFVDQQVQVPRGGAVTLYAKADTTAQLVPELCTVFYQQSDGARGRANMRRIGAAADGWQTFSLDGPPLVDLTSDVLFDIVGGDARLDDFHLRVVDPAVITTMQLELTYPTYLLASKPNLPPRETLEFRSGLRIPEGTAVTLKGTASSPLQAVQYVVRSTTANSQASTAPASTTSSAAQLSSELAGASETVVQSVAPEGNLFRLPLGVVQATQVVEIRLLDQYGLSADQIPRYTLAVTADAVPEVESRLVGIGTAVTPKAVLPMQGKATDDNGLERVWATVVVNEQPPVEVEVEVDSSGNLSPRIDLQQLRESGRLRVAPDSTLGLAISAVDRFDLGGIKHTGSGQPIQLGIVDEQKLLVMIDRQELELRQRLELIINELTQLRDVLREQASVALPGAAGARPQHSWTVAMSAFQQPTSPSSAEPGKSADLPDDELEAGSAAEQLQRLMLLRAQQSVLQGDKSQQELIGLAGLVEDIRLQLINNRIDSVDRQNRLQEKVHAPLKSMLAAEMEALRSRLSQFQSAAMSPVTSPTIAPSAGPAQAALALQENERVLAALNAIVANLLELESFNELSEEIRKLIEDQQQLLQETQSKQKQDLLKSLKLLQD